MNQGLGRRIKEGTREKSREYGSKMIKGGLDKNLLWLLIGPLCGFSSLRCVYFQKFKEDRPEICFKQREGCASNLNLDKDLTDLRSNNRSSLTDI